MKISPLKFAVGAAALAASESSPIEARPGNPSAEAALAHGNLRGLPKTKPGSRNVLSSSDGCRARIKERQNDDAVYTVFSGSKDVCPKWILSVQPRHLSPDSGARHARVGPTGRA